ncbi:MAG: hypothetical protein U0031_11285 [Thermomicrobiales bacterium]
MPPDHAITVTVQSGRGSREFSFAKQTKAEDAANQAAAAFGYPEGGNYVLVRATTSEELAGQRPLVSYGIEDGEVLILSETGSGV